MLPSKSWDHKLLNGNHRHFCHTHPTETSPEAAIDPVFDPWPGVDGFGSFFFPKDRTTKLGVLEDLLFLFIFFLRGGGGGVGMFTIWIVSFTKYNSLFCTWISRRVVFLKRSMTFKKQALTKDHGDIAKALGPRAPNKSETPFQGSWARAAEPMVTLRFSAKGGMPGWRHQKIQSAFGEGVLCTCFPITSRW